MPNIRFVEHLKAINSSENTVRSYTCKIARFEKFLKSSNETWETMPPNMLELFVTYLSKHVSATSIRMFIQAVEQFLKWAERNGVKVATWNRPPLPRPRHKIQFALAEQAVTDYSRFVTEYAEEPFKTALLILPATGLRVFELCNIKLCDLHFPAGSVVISVTGKGNKDRLVPMLDYGKKFLTSYLEGWRDLHHHDSPYLFPSPLRAVPLKPIHQGSLQKLMRHVRKPMGFNRLTPHALRRTYLSTLANYGLPHYELAAIAGHANINTTHQHYIRPDFNRMMEKITRIGKNR